MIWVIITHYKGQVANGDYRYQIEGAPPAADLITIIGADGRPVARLEVRPDPIFGDQARSQRHETISNRDLFRVVTADALGVQRLLAFRIIK